MRQDAPELTTELVADGVVPSQPAISPDWWWVAYVVAPAGRKAFLTNRHPPSAVPRALPPIWRQSHPADEVLSSAQNRVIGAATTRTHADERA
jgi:hypothetical protein